MKKNLVGQLFTRYALRRAKFVVAMVICCQLSYSQMSVDSVINMMSPEADRQRSMIDATHVIGSGDEVSKKDSISRLLERFYLDQFRHSQDPRAPYFMFLSKNGDIAMGVGGLVRIRGYFDWNGSIPISGFSPYSITIPKDPTSMKRMAATPAGTGLFFTVLGSNRLLGDYMAFFQADFSGYNNRDFKLKKAYIQAGNWTAGYTTTTFEDSKSKPVTIDGAGPNGFNSRTNVLVRYMHTFKNKWTLAGSIEIPSSSIDADGEYTKACSDYIPDFAAFMQYQWNGGMSHVRLSGLARVLTYRDMLHSSNHDIFGWGVQVSAVVKVLPPLNVYGIASFGKGYASYASDLAMGNYDLIADAGKKGTLYAPTAVGCVLGAQYYFSSKVFADVVLSGQGYYPKQDPGDSQYRYGLYGAANLFWDITSRFEVGLEYLVGKRVNFDGTNGSANRVTAMMMLSF